MAWLVSNGRVIRSTHEKTRHSRAVDCYLVWGWFPALIALLLRLARVRRPMLMSTRSAVFLLLTLALGPPLLVNEGLKTYWTRPRPVQVTEFGGRQKFIPWWNPRGGCSVRCSFVAGETATASWAYAPAALAPVQWRPLAYIGVFILAAISGTQRLAFGAHFFSDVAFAEIVIFFSIWLIHGVIIRWPARYKRSSPVETGTAAGGSAA